MPSFPFPLPSPFGGFGSSGLSFVPTERALQLGLTPATLPGALDRVIDPRTLDYVRQPDGTWAETADSRTIVFIALSVRLGGSIWDPQDGTTIASIRERGEPASPDIILADTQRVGVDLAKDGILSGFVATVLDNSGRLNVDTLGRVVLRCSWHDLASGSPVNAVYAVR